MNANGGQGQDETMAAVDKIYANRVQHNKLWYWLEEHNPDALRYMALWNLSGPDVQSIATFSEDIDTWLLENCPFEWVTNRIREQYGLEEPS